MHDRLWHLMERATLAIEQRFTPPAAMPAKVLGSRVVLVGASVSESWNIDVRYPNIEVRTRFEFDKSPDIEGLLAKGQAPAAIVIKQCAAYFPAPLEPRKLLVESWLDRLGQAEVTPILATVVPVTRAHDDTNPGRLEGLLEYNGWIRHLAQDRSLAVLDLEAAVRRGPGDPCLDERWAAPDGLHLCRSGYRKRLDPIVQPVLVEALSD